MDYSSFLLLVKCIMLCMCFSRYDCHLLMSIKRLKVNKTELFIKFSLIFFVFLFNDYLKKFYLFINFLNFKLN